MCADLFRHLESCERRLELFEVERLRAKCVHARIQCVLSALRVAVGTHAHNGHVWKGRLALLSHRLLLLVFPRSEALGRLEAVHHGHLQGHKVYESEV